MTLTVPWALLLLLPAAVWWWRHPGPGRWLRAAALLLLIAAAAGPRLAEGGGGVDLVVVADRSASMGDRRGELDGILAIAGGQRGDRDRIALVAVGDGARTVQGPAPAVPAAHDAGMPDDGSDLAAGLAQAAALIAPGRSVRVLVVSDGEATGGDPVPGAARIAALGGVVDVLAAETAAGPDAAVVQVDLPPALRVGESFLGRAVVLGDRDEPRTFTVRREGSVIASGTVALAAGRPQAIPFQDRPAPGGVHRYEILLDDRGDRRPGNNRWQAALRVEGGERVLCIPRGGHVAAILRAAGMAVEEREPGGLTLADLSGRTAVVVEGLDAGRIGAGGQRALATWVRHLGGGLLLTGGRMSGGAGGWHRSPVEEVLPVTFELRDEHRRLTLALIIALDRSGSMAAPAGPGRTKMDLADEGAAAAAALLGPRDEIAVYAVDSAPHEVVPLTRVTDGAAIAREIRGIRSQGGGIYVYEALAACAKAVGRANASTRHVVLFADAADAEEPGDWEPLVDRLTAAGVTVSVIAMGLETDVDADLLRAIARRGGGRIAFAEEADDIPRLFAQETVVVARSSWVGSPVALRPLPAATELLGALKPEPWPTVSGYNLAYARPRAQTLALAPGDPAAPALAAWRLGTGRSAWLGLDLGAESEAALRASPVTAPLVASLVRWLAGDAPPGDGLLSAERHGRTVLLRLEAAASATAGPVSAVLAGGGGEVLLHPVAAGLWEGEATLPRDGVVIPAVGLAGGLVLGPALTMPHPAEDAPRFDRPAGASVLESIARAGNGRLREDLREVFARPPSPGTPRDLARPLAIAAFVLVAMEWLIVRLGLGWPRWRWPVRRRTVAAPAAASPPAASPAASDALPSPAAPAPAPPAGTLADGLDAVRRRHRGGR